MATRFDAVSEWYSATNGLPAANNVLTVTCWMWLTANPAAQMGVWDIRNVTSGFYVSLLVDPGPNLFCGATADNVAFPTVGFNSIVAATWYGVAVAVNGTNARFVRVTAPNGTPTTSTSTTFTAPSGAPDTRYIGTQNASTARWFDGRVAAVKAWNAELTQTECETELGQYVPARTANLLSFHPLQTPSTTDYSGNGNTLSLGVGTSEEAGPDLPWGFVPRVTVLSQAMNRAANL